MDVSMATIWWVLAGIAVALELATGTFYLLMLALGMVAGALAAHLGLPLAGQIVAAAGIGGGATALWNWRRVRQPKEPIAASNRDVNLDITDRVHVDAWTPEGTARVQHRGSVWTAKLAPGAPALSGEHVISAVEGNWLVLAPVEKH
jgi:membrane protein implicated in regulation of membrane protease activity